MVVDVFVTCLSVLRSCTRFVVQQATNATLFEVAVVDCDMVDCDMVDCDMVYCIWLVQANFEHAANEWYILACGTIQKYCVTIVESIENASVVAVSLSINRRIMSQTANMIVIGTVTVQCSWWDCQTYDADQCWHRWYGLSAPSGLSKSYLPLTLHQFIKRVSQPIHKTIAQLL